MRLPRPWGGLWVLARTGLERYQSTASVWLSPLTPPLSPLSLIPTWPRPRAGAARRRVRRRGSDGEHAPRRGGGGAAALRRRRAAESHDGGLRWQPPLPSAHVDESTPTAPHRL
jgi:hypothetical protein